ncbi:periplasmic heavy metal sensor [Spongiibacter nanhainus]|uniref:Signaling pathway modulator ZraP n=1 Tax=Spongiibacter nanhainus TaxID=2794344 RepID=A0A7T4UPF8_9GAMM|nr:periplasmic heavy metal sensor [Spongiibacter nanhainus]QQD17586.1 periplasmic heavy metal sensor [Spongiibacter nanhainus]
MTGRRWLLVALLLSLLVNGAVLGLIVSERLVDGEARAVRDISRMMLRDAPEQFRGAIREGMVAHRAEARSAFRELQSARRDVLKMLKAEPLDAEALSLGFQRIRQADSALKGVMHQVLIEVLPSLSAAERTPIAERHELRRKKFKDKKPECETRPPSPGQRQEP